MDHIFHFPHHCATEPAPALLLGSLIATKCHENLIERSCRHVLTLLDVEEAPYLCTPSDASPPAAEPPRASSRFKYVTI